MMKSTTACSTIAPRWSGRQISRASNCIPFFTARRVSNGRRASSSISIPARRPASWNVASSRSRCENFWRRSIWNASPKPPARKGCKSSCRSVRSRVMRGRNHSPSASRNAFAKARRKGSSPKCGARCGPGKPSSTGARTIRTKRPSGSIPCAPVRSRPSPRRFRGRRCKKCVPTRDPKTLVFDSGEVLGRVKRRGGLFAPMIEFRQKLPKAY